MDSDHLRRGEQKLGCEQKVVPYLHQHQEF
jgi:hypothetical protein